MCTFVHMHTYRNQSWRSCWWPRAAPRSLFPAQHVATPSRVSGVNGTCNSSHVDLFLLLSLPDVPSPLSVFLQRTKMSQWVRSTGYLVYVCAFYFIVLFVCMHVCICIYVCGCLWECVIWLLRLVVISILSRTVHVHECFAFLQFVHFPKVAVQFLTKFHYVRRHCQRLQFS